MKIAHYHVEACDNAKYLGATEQYSHRIYLEVTLRKWSVYVSLFGVNPGPDEGPSDEVVVHGEDDLQHFGLLQQLCSSGFPSREDHLPGHHQLQELHHRQRKGS